MPKITLGGLLKLHEGHPVTHNKLVNIRGCNGSGKSTIPIMMMNTDPYTFEVVWEVDGKERVIATVFPSYKWAALGHYHSKCGGMDSMKTTDEIKAAVKALWAVDYNLIMEGIMASTVRQTYIDLFSELRSTQTVHRDIIIFNLLPPLSVCLKRIQERNGGKPIKEDAVRGKWDTMARNVKYFADAGFTSVRVNSAKVAKHKMLKAFLKTIEKYGG